MNRTVLEALIQEQKDEWQTLMKILEERSRENLHAPETPEWTSRDIYAHLARWMNYSLDNFEAVLNGRNPSTLELTVDEINALNARWIKEDSALSLDEARDKARTTFERWIRTIESVPPERCDDTFIKFVRVDGSWHYELHRSDIVAGDD